MLLLVAVWKLIGLGAVDLLARVHRTILVYHRGIIKLWKFTIMPVAPWGSVHS